jgi:hypothetical protein
MPHPRRLVGGASDPQRLIESGELNRMLGR